MAASLRCVLDEDAMLEGFERPDSCSFMSYLAQVRKKLKSPIRSADDQRAIGAMTAAFRFTKSLLFDAMISVYLVHAILGIRPSARDGQSLDSQDRMDEITSMHGKT